MSTATRQRAIKPQVINVFDNAVVQVKCEPGVDELDVHSILKQSLDRFEFILGTSFDLQFLSMDGDILYAVQRYIVNHAKEKLVRSDINNYQSITRNVTDRRCAPIGPFFALHDDAHKLFAPKEEPEEAVAEAEPQTEPVAKEPPKKKDIKDMNAGELQAVMKELTGQGFRIGTDKKTMIRTLRRKMVKID